ncbi:hypothetical protein ES702_01301 [subsurface metagenome]
MTDTHDKALLEVVRALDKITLVYGLSRKENGSLSIELSLDNVNMEAER